MFVDEQGPNEHNMHITPAHKALSRGFASFHRWPACTLAEGCGLWQSTPEDAVSTALLRLPTVVSVPVRLTVKR